MIDYNSPHELTQQLHRELDAKIAELMGLPVKYHTNNPNNERFYYLDVPDHNGMCPDLPHYSRDISAAYQMEERIKELGLEEKYINRLIRLLGISAPYLDQLFILVHATPEDRCRAAVLAAEAE